MEKGLLEAARTDLEEVFQCLEFHGSSLCLIPISLKS